MSLVLGLLVLAGALIGLVSSIFILINAFQVSVGKGFLVLCVPCYIIYFIASEFQHPKKSLIVTGWVVGIATNLIANFAMR
ncbi:MAG: hypothetical protein WBV82_12615 [Myxococcaceae bacterium]